MARYLLVHTEKQYILGCQMDKGGERPFVSLAEAFETLARMAERDGYEPWTDFNLWRVCELKDVEA